MKTNILIICLSTNFINQRIKITKYSEHLLVFMMIESGIKCQSHYTIKHHVLQLLNFCQILSSFFVQINKDI